MSLTPFQLNVSAFWQKPQKANHKEQIKNNIKISNTKQTTLVFQ